jgi:hypothetical protein
LYAHLEAKPGKESEVEEFLKGALPIVQQETGTITWFAIKLGPGRYGIFDVFPAIDKIDVLAAKLKE